jgi:hypothetical protein
MRNPYWVRTVRPDWLLMELSEAVINSTMDSQDPTTRIEFTGRELIIFFQVNQMSLFIKLTHFSCYSPNML